MLIADKFKGTTVFVGCGFAAKYMLGGGNFSVPLQWMLGLLRLGVDAIWLEHFPATNDPESDARHIQSFEKHLSEHGLSQRFCLLYQRCPEEEQTLETMDCHGMTKEEFTARLQRPNILLNLCNSIHAPLLTQFERRVFCDLDPGEVSYWMSRLDMGQSCHHDFWTIGLNLVSEDCTAEKPVVAWKTFYPLVDTQLYQPLPRPERSRITTVTQWYWASYMEVNGTYPDFSKQASFERFIDLPAKVPAAEMELAVNLNADDPEMDRLRSHGWNLVHPHAVAASPADYRKYLAGSLAEFTPGKGFHALWRTGWFSDRAAAYLATGRPAITDDTGMSRYLPEDSGVLLANTLSEAVEAVERVLKDWDHLSRKARETAVEYFDSAKVLERMLATLVN